MFKYFYFKIKINAHKNARSKHAHQKSICTIGTSPALMEEMQFHRSSDNFLLKNLRLFFSEFFSLKEAANMDIYTKKRLKC